MKISHILCFLAAAILGAPTPSVAQRLRYMETEHLRLVFIDGLHSFISPHAARCFENSYNFHRQLWRADLKGKTAVYLHDMGDQGNGGAKNIPDNMIIAALAPFNYAYETMPANERLYTVMNHEVAHLYAMDRTAGRDRFFRGLFMGKPEPIAEQPLSIAYDFLTSPRRSVPRWYHEGLAVFLETWMAGGYGRALGAYDEMAFRTLVCDSGYFYDQVGVESEATRADFHVGVNSYLYGTRFISYLGLKYGPESVMRWVSRRDSSNAYFTSQFHRTFGVSLDDAWRQWVSFERDFQRQNLEKVQEYPVTPYRDLTAQALGSMSRAYLDRDGKTLYTAVNFPGEIPFIGAIDIATGRIRHLCDVKGASLFYVCALTYDSSAQSLYYTSDNYDWRDLCVYDIQKGHSRTLMKDVRVGDLTFNHVDKSIWGVRHYNGLSTVVRIPHPYKEWNRVFTLPYGKDFYDLDLSPDGHWLSASLAEVSGRQTLTLMNTDSLLAGDTAIRTLHDFGNSIPQNFTFSEDARSLYGSAYYTGVSNAFRYDLVSGEMEALSNVETGVFRPVVWQGDSLIVFRYTTRGFVPAVIPLRPIEDVNAITYLGQAIVDQHPVVKDWTAGSPGRVELDSLTLREGIYHPMTTWTFAYWYPIVEGYKSTTAAGLRMDFYDWLGLQHLDLTASYSPETQLPRDERWHVRTNYSYLDWKASFSYNGADFYDLFGPTKSSRKGVVGSLTHTKSLVYDDPRLMNLELSVSGYTGLERLPDYQNIDATIDQFAIGNVRLNYENLRQSLGAVDREKGYSWELQASGTIVSDRKIPQLLGTFDAGLPLPLDHSSIWARTAAGFSTGDREDPFANFFLGGFGNNWVDHGTVKRYREWYSFPGLELNQIGGTNFGKLTLEWTLPPLRFRRLGIPAFYCTWIRAALFSSAAMCNLDDPASQQSAASYGGQLDLQIQLLSQLKLTLSGGYARAHEKHRRGSDEVMVSLKVL